MSERCPEFSIRCCCSLGSPLPVFVLSAYRYCCRFDTCAAVMVLRNSLFAACCFCPQRRTDIKTVAIRMVYSGRNGFTNPRLLCPYIRLDDADGGEQQASESTYLRESLMLLREGECEASRCAYRVRGLPQTGWWRASHCGWQKHPQLLVLADRGRAFFGNIVYRNEPLSLCMIRIASIFVASALLLGSP